MSNSTLTEELKTRVAKASWLKRFKMANTISGGRGTHLENVVKAKGADLRKHIETPPEA